MKIRLDCEMLGGSKRTTWTTNDEMYYLERLGLWTHQKHVWGHMVEENSVILSTRYKLLESYQHSIMDRDWEFMDPGLLYDYTTYILGYMNDAGLAFDLSIVELLDFKNPVRDYADKYLTRRQKKLYVPGT